jgi:hypothetical protein
MDEDSNSRVFITTVREKGSESHRVDVRIESTRTLLASPPRHQQYDSNIVHWRLSVHRLASQQFPSSGFDNWNTSSSWFPAPSGIHVSVQLRPTRAGDDKKRFLKLLQQLVGERWIAAPLVSLEKKRLQRFIEKKPVSSDLIEYSVTLPMEGSPLSAEGLAMLLAQDNKHASESTLTTDCPGFLASLQPNATKWSEILLGQSPLSSSHPSRGLWMQWNRK